MMLYAILSFDKSHTLTYEYYNVSSISYFFESTIQQQIKKVSKELILNAKDNNTYEITHKIGEIELKI